MRRIARLTLLYVLEAVAALLALAVVLAGAALWRLAEGPVDADLMRPVITEALLEAVDGDAAAIGALELSFDPALAALVISARDVSVARAGGEVLVASEEVEAALALDLLLVGQLAPVRLRAQGGSVALLRSEDGRLSASLGGLDALSARSNGAPRGLAAPRRDLLDRLLEAELSDVSLQIRDEMTDWTGLFTDMQAALNLSRGAVSLDASGALVTSAGLAPMRLDLETARGFDSVFVELQVSNLVPAATAPRRGLIAQLAALDAPFTLDLVFDATRQTGLNAADLTLSAGEGVVRVNGRDVPLQAARFDFGLDAELGEIQVREAQLQSGLLDLAVSGRVFELAGFDDAIPSRARFSLALAEGGFDLDGVFPEPVQWAGASLEGGLDLDALELSFETLDVALGGANATLAGAVSLAQTDAGWRPNIQLSGPIAGRLSKADVLRHWPVDFALGARDWVRDSILGGVVSDARLQLDLTAQALAAQSIGDEALSLRFAFSDADVRYMSTMTPLLGLSGQAELRGNSLSLQGAGGAIGDIRAETIYVEIPRLNPKGAIARFGGSGRGPAQAFLQLVNEPPLQIADAYGFDPADFGGEGEVSFEIRRPMRRTVPAEDLGYRVTGQFENVSGPTGAQGLELANGVVRLEVSPDGLVADGAADVGAARASIVWRETFGLPEGDPSSAVVVNTRMSARELDQFGLPVRRFMDGVIGVEAELSGRGMAFSGVDLTLDLADAAIAAPGGVWDKPAGEAARAELVAGFPASGPVLETFRLFGNGIEVDAAAELAPDGRLLRAVAERVFIDRRMDLAARADRPEGADGPLRIAVSGAFLDAEDLFGIAAPAGGGALGAPLLLEGDLDRVLVRDQAFDDVGLQLHWRPEGLARFALEADASGGPVIIRFEPEADTGVRRLSAAGADAGVLLSAFAGFDNVAGGALRLQGQAPPLGEPGGVTGAVEVDGFTLERMPLLARVLAAGSLEGLGGLLSGQGIEFERLQTEFVWSDGMLEMREARVAGPSLGATWTGLVNFSQTRLDVDGTLLPSYGVNSVLGSLPVLGELLTSRRGEGVIGITFSVSGPFNETRVLANPLSALAPGVLRRIFEGTSAERELDALEQRRREAESGPDDEPPPSDADPDAEPGSGPDPERGEPGDGPPAAPDGAGP